MKKRILSFASIFAAIIISNYFGDTIWKLLLIIALFFLSIYDIISGGEKYD
jgi:hypothetical protein